MFFRHSLHSSRIDVSYFAAGIFAHILSDDSVEWDMPQPSKETMIKELVGVALFFGYFDFALCHSWKLLSILTSRLFLQGDVVLGWDDPTSEIVAYR